MNPDSQIVADAFFLHTAREGRYCMYYPVPVGIACQGSILLIPPFGEELNRTRRLAAQQARLLALSGYAVLQIDLYGCGDSAGELRDSTWEIWLDDLEAAHAWIVARTNQLPVLWAVRLGALLALDLAARLEQPADRLLLWAPAISGQLFARQLLRQHLVGQLVHDNTEPAVDTDALRRKLSSGETIEIAGYELPPKLVSAIETRNAGAMTPRCQRVDWLDINPNAGQSVPVATRQLVDKWTSEGVHVRYLPVQAPQFWSIQDTTECPQLLQATVAAVLNPET